MTHSITQWPLALRLLCLKKVSNRLWAAVKDTYFVTFSPSLAWPIHSHKQRQLNKVNHSICTQALLKYVSHISGIAQSIFYLRIYLIMQIFSFDRHIRDVTYALDIMDIVLSFGRDVAFVVDETDSMDIVLNI